MTLFSVHMLTCHSQTSPSQHYLALTATTKPCASPVEAGSPDEPGRFLSLPPERLCTMSLDRPLDLDPPL